MTSRTSRLLNYLLQAAIPIASVILGAFIAHRGILVSNEAALLRERESRQFDAIDEFLHEATLAFESQRRWALNQPSIGSIAGKPERLDMLRSIDLLHARLGTLRIVAPSLTKPGVRLIEVTERGYALLWRSEYSTGSVTGEWQSLHQEFMDAREGFIEGAQLSIGLTPLRSRSWAPMAD